MTSKDVIDSMNELSDSVRKAKSDGLTLDDRMDVVVNEVFPKPKPKPAKPKFNVNTDITKWFNEYVSLYQALNFSYELKLPKGKGKQITVICGGSLMKFDIPQDLDCYNAFMRYNIKMVTVAEQHRLV